MVTPFVDASHLAASSSFFSAVLQPLGLQFINAGSRPVERDNSSNLDNPPRPAITYGAHGKAVLQIRQGPSPASALPLTLSAVVFTAPSRSAVSRFYASALKANPLLTHVDAPRLSTSHSQAARHTAWLATDESGVTRAVAHDLDGNSMEVMYPDPRPRQNPVHYTGNSVRKTQSTRDEVGRILDWNYGVASSTSSQISVSASGVASGLESSRSSAMTRPQQGPSQSLRRMNPSDISRHQHHDASLQQAAPRPAHVSQTHSSPQQHQTSASGGLSTTAVVGALLGVAAGAALTYGLVAKERSRVPRHDIDLGDDPGLPRRATFPERLAPASHKAMRYGGQDKRHRFVVDDDGEYTTRRIGYTDVVDDFENAWPAPKYLPQRIRGATTVSYNGARTTPRSRAVDDSFDRRSRHSSQLPEPRSRSDRSRSEAPAARAPVVSLELDQRSHAVSRHSTVPGSYHSNSQAARLGHEHDDESYVSAQTHRSAATVRRDHAPPPGSPMVRELAYRSRPSSTASTIKPRASDARSLARPLFLGCPPSYVSARNIALPPSDVGSSQANLDDDLGSVAPDDSISCVGSKTSRRSRRHF